MVRVGVVKNYTVSCRSVVAAENLVEKYREMSAQITACLLNFTRLRAPVFRSPDSEKMKCSRRRNAFRTVRVGYTVYVYAYIKPVLYNSKLKGDQLSWLIKKKKKYHRWKKFRVTLIENLT